MLHAIYRSSMAGFMSLRKICVQLYADVHKRLQSTRFHHELTQRIKIFSMWREMCSCSQLGKSKLINIDKAADKTLNRESESVKRSKFDEA